MSRLNDISFKLKRKGKYLLRDIGHRLGLYNSFYNNSRGSRILIYHGICKEDHTRFNPIFLRLKTFEQHLKFYKKHFNVVSMQDFYQEKFCTDKFNVCLTFDDGFANNYFYVLPLLEHYQIPATFFITAIREAGYDILWNDFLGIASKYGSEHITFNNQPYRKGLHDKYISVRTGISLNEQLRSAGFNEKAEMMKQLYSLIPFKNNKHEKDYWLQMTEVQIKAMSASKFVSIGAHGYFHNDLARIPLNDATKELEDSKRYLENIIQKPVNSFAFPYGSYTPAVVNSAKQTGFEQLLATDFTDNKDIDDLSMRERFTVNPFISTNNQMYATVKKRYET